MIGKSDLQSKTNYDTLKTKLSSNNSNVIPQDKGKAANPPSVGAARSSPWISSNTTNNSQSVNTAPNAGRALVGGGGAAFRNTFPQAVLNQGVTGTANSSMASVIKSSVPSAAPAVNSSVPPGYYQGPSGKWFRPDGKFASNVEVGLPAPVKPTSGGKGGRLGNDATRAQNMEIGDFFESIGGKVTGGGGRGPEEYLPGPNGGRKGSNYLDITAEVDGKIVRVNTVDVLADGKTLSKRELDAAEAIFGKTGEEIITIPKGSGLGDLRERFPSVNGTAGTVADAAKTADTAVDAVKAGTTANAARTADTAVDAVKASTVANATTDIAGDALKSTARSGWGTAAKYGGKALGVVGTVMDAKELYDSYQADGGKIGENTVTSAGGIAGSWGGAALGAKAGAIGGAALGSVIPVVGTAVGGVIGGILGGIVGGLGGNWFGKKVANKAYNGINGDN